MSASVRHSSDGKREGRRGVCGMSDGDDRRDTCYSLSSLSCLLVSSVVSVWLPVCDIRAFMS